MAKKRAAKGKPDPSPAADAAEVLASGIRGFDWIDPRGLAAHPRNVRRHPPEQVAELRESIAAAGWSKPLIFNDRTGRLIDGHLRLQVALEDGVDLVPVNYGEWTEEQEDLLLAVLDPISSHATVDPEAYRALRDRLDVATPALRAMLDAQMEDLKGRLVSFRAQDEPSPPEDFPEHDESIDTEYCCPKCGYAWSGKPQ